ncbi:MAG: hemolysin III family protein [Micrococcales bacterium]
MSKAAKKTKSPLSKLPISNLDVKPTWRGWIHTGALPLVVASGVVLIVLAHGGWAKAAASIYLACSVLLFGMSALYHRFNWRPSVKLALKRVDHSNIFLLIAGTYTPITLLALPAEKGSVLIWIIWGTALLGISFRVFWTHAPRWLYVPIYIGMGWVALAFVTDFFAANTPMMILVLSGGLAYTLGAIVYATKWPNPSKRHFGFHEIFHAFTVLAYMSQWVGVLLISLSPAAGSVGG